MLLLVDESAGKKLALLLISAGHDVVFVGDVMPSVSDEEVLVKAASESRILISDDKDFGELVVRQRKPATGVILLRTLSTNPKIRANAVAKILNDMDAKGKLNIVKEGRVRVRNL